MILHPLIQTFAAWLWNSSRRFEIDCKCEPGCRMFSSGSITSGLFRYKAICHYDTQTNEKHTRRSRGREAFGHEHEQLPDSC